MTTVENTLNSAPTSMTTTSPASPFNVEAGNSQAVTLSIPSTTQSGDYQVIVSGQPSGMAPVPSNMPAAAVGSLTTVNIVDKGFSPELIHTVRGAGYCLRAPD